MAMAIWTLELNFNLGLECIDIGVKVLHSLPFNNLITCKNYLRDCQHQCLAAKKELKKKYRTTPNRHHFPTKLKESMWVKPHAVQNFLLPPVQIAKKEKADEASCSAKHPASVFVSTRMLVDSKIKGVVFRPRHLRGFQHTQYLMAVVVLSLSGRWSRSRATTRSYATLEGKDEEL